MEVKHGERGLRQSTAVFQHIQNMACLIKKIKKTVSLKNTLAISASIKPRPLEESYMPVFKVGEKHGQAFSGLLDIPFYSTTHQEGHLWAALYPFEVKPEKFLALHISGGTTELLKVTRHNNNFEIAKIGGSSDLPLGQFIDRIGVKMGLPFPSGPYLEELALKSVHPLDIPVSVKGCQVSYSGPLTFAERQLDKGYKPEELARGIETAISKSLLYILKAAIKQTDLSTVVLIGGVASNRFIKNYMLSSFKDGKLIFTSPELSRDNAVGVSYYGWCRYFKIYS